MEEAAIIWNVLFGAIGLGFFTYGRRQKAVIPLITGVVLFIFPYFVPDVYSLVIVGCVLVVLPYFVRI